MLISYRRRRWAAGREHVMQGRRWSEAGYPWAKFRHSGGTGRNGITEFKKATRNLTQSSLVRVSPYVEIRTQCIVNIISGLCLGHSIIIFVFSAWENHLDGLPENQNENKPFKRMKLLFFWSIYDAGHYCKKLSSCKFELTREFLRYPVSLRRHLHFLLQANPLNYRQLH